MITENTDDYDFYLQIGQMLLVLTKMVAGLIKVESKEKNKK